MPPGNTSQFERHEKSRRKHPPSNSGASRAPLAPPSTRPGWKGPAFIKKTSTKNKAPRSSSLAPSSGPSIQAQLLPVELQQLLLNVFRATFSVSRDPEGLRGVLRRGRDALGRRDFAGAFFGGEEEGEAWREAYAVRWGAGRGLVVGEVMVGVVEGWKGEGFVRALRGEREMDGKMVDVGGLQGKKKKEEPPRVVCIGGGAAEVMAFGALMRLLRPESRGRAAGDEVVEGIARLGVSGPSASEVEDVVLDLRLLDVAPWGNVISKLHAGLTTPPPLSKYASASARASNASFIHPSSMSVAFTQADALEMDQKALAGIVGDGPVMVTLFFTLNELYTRSVAKTTRFLYELSVGCPKGALLCVVDSPGSYPEAGVAEGEGGRENRRYPMHWLMDHALLGNARRKGRQESEEGESDSAMWEKLMVDESRWYRLEESLKYPVSLENVRFQVHLFKRL